jgi:hypothetical protein
VRAISTAPPPMISRCWVRVSSLHRFLDAILHIQARHHFGQVTLENAPQARDSADEKPGEGKRLPRMRHPTKPLYALVATITLEGPAAGDRRERYATVSTRPVAGA